MSTDARQKLFSVDIHDCDVQVFRAGGNGGQAQNTTDSGVRVIHRPSGARAECRETRSQTENRRRAFVKMARSPLFQAWISVQAGRVKSDERIREEVDAELADLRKLRIEVGNGKRWRAMSKDDEIHE